LDEHIAEVGCVQIVTRALRNSICNELTSFEIIGVAEALDTVEIFNLIQVALEELAKLLLTVEKLCPATDLEHLDGHFMVGVARPVTLFIT